MNLSKIEKCARLMGYGGVDGIVPIPTPDGQWREFNPLTNKADLVDLMCAVGIDVEWFNDIVLVWAPMVCNDNQTISDHPDKQTALAHAVVDVACQIYDRQFGDKE